MMFGCPGSKSLKEPSCELVPCAKCDYDVEIWNDEYVVSCPRCKTAVKGRARGSKCVEWCSFGPACVGEKVFKMHMQNKAMSIKEGLIGELEKYFGPDTKRINHAKKVMGYAEELLLSEKGDSE